MIRQDRTSLKHPKYNRTTFRLEMGGPKWVEGIRRIRATREVACIKGLLTDPSVPQPWTLPLERGNDITMPPSPRAWLKQAIVAKWRSGGHGVQQTVQTRLKQKCIAHACEYTGTQLHMIRHPYQAIRNQRTITKVYLWLGISINMLWWHRLPLCVFRVQMSEFQVHWCSYGVGNSRP